MLKRELCRIFDPLIESRQTVQSLVFAFSVMILAPAWALPEGSELPALSVTSGGEFVFVDGKGAYQPWNSEHAPRRLSLVQVLAASTKAATLNEDFFDLLETREYADEELQSTILIVSKKIPGPFRGFVKSNLKKNKKLYPESVLIDDRAGISWETWAPNEDLSTIILVDENRKVLFYQEGKLSDENTEVLLQLIATKVQREVAAAQATAKEE